MPHDPLERSGAIRLLIYWTKKSTLLQIPRLIIFYLQRLSIIQDAMQNQSVPYGGDRAAEDGDKNTTLYWNVDSENLFEINIRPLRPVFQNTGHPTTHGFFLIEPSPVTGYPLMRRNAGRRCIENLGFPSPR